jgi:hypothetical protein
MKDIKMRKNFLIFILDQMEKEPSPFDQSHISAIGIIMPKHPCPNSSLE